MCACLPGTGCNRPACAGGAAAHLHPRAADALVKVGGDHAAHAIPAGCGSMVGGCVGVDQGVWEWTRVCGSGPGRQALHFLHLQQRSGDATMPGHVRTSACRNKLRQPSATSSSWALPGGILSQRSPSSTTVQLHPQFLHLLYSSSSRPPSMRASTKCARFTPERHTAQAASSGAGRPRSYLRMGEGGGEEAAGHGQCGIWRWACIERL